mgnify:CR=1 FL=1
MQELIFQFNSSGGLTPGWTGHPGYENPQPHLNVFGNDSMYTEGVVNPFRQPGFLSPATSAVTAITTAEAGTAFVDVVNIIQVDTINTTIYVGEASGTMFRIQRLDSFTDTTLNAINQVNGLSGALASDFEIYSLNGVTSLFYAYNKGSAGEMGIYNNFSSFDDDYLSSSATGGFVLGANRHRLIVADNGFMYILDGSEIHRFDGTTEGGGSGTIKGRVVVFPNPFRLVDGVDSRGFLWVALVSDTRDFRGVGDSSVTGQVTCGVYIWDRQSTRVAQTDFIPVPGVKEIHKIFFFDGKPWLITSSTNRLTEIREYNGSEFVVKFELPRGARPRFVDSVQVRSNKVYWIGRDDGIVWCLGRIFPDAPIGIHKIGDMTPFTRGDTWGSGGALAIAGGRPSVASGDYLEPETVIVNFSTQTNSKNLINRWYPDSRTITGETLTVHPGRWRSIVKPIPKLSTINGLSVFFPPNTSVDSESLYIQLYYNRSNNVTTTAVLNEVDAARGWYWTSLTQENVNYVQLGVVFNGDQPVTKHIFPEYAKVHYTKTDKIK